MADQKPKINKIITIDGPSGVGKGTAARLIAKQLGWKWLDSGALYRLTALASERLGVSVDDQEKLAQIARNLKVEFVPDEEGLESLDPPILLNGEKVNNLIRTETCGNRASSIGIHPEVRAALFDLQRSFYDPKIGLVTDGRDMGTIIFPEAPLKIFLTASAEERAKRRQRQLNGQGIDVNIAPLLAEIEARDLRDRTRKVAPLVPAKGALVIDTSCLGPSQVCRLIFDQIHVAFSLPVLEQTLN